MTRHKLHIPKRIFIGIRLPEEFSDSFISLQSDLGELPGRFIPPEDIHLTLVPPFETRDLPYVKGTLRVALGHVHKFRLRFSRLSYGPDKERPRLAWIECDATKEIISLKKKLLKALNKKEKIPFVPHMTIARFKKADSENITHRPIKRPVRFSMDVESIELFQSPHKGGSGYKVLASIRLQPKDGAPLWHKS